MLVQKALCRTLFGHLTKTSQFLNGPNTRAWQPQSMLRSIRDSAQRQNPSRSNTIQAPLAPLENYVTGGPVPPGNVVKAVIFTGAFSVGVFMGATVLEYENARSMMMSRMRQSKLNFFKRNSKSETSQWEHFKQDVERFWNNLAPGEKVFAPICALNLLVFGLWRVPSLRNTMLKYFCSNPVGRAVCWPMFLSTFSHYSAFHIFANMYVLHSFSNAAVMTMGKEQFLGVYLAAGVVASLTSILYKAATAQAGLSIGASGAIMAILAYVCSLYPDTQLGILFLPMITFSAGAAIKVVMGIDIAGCILGWKFFDHAAHLGGAIFGIFWAYYGAEVWQKRIRFLTLYHDLRKTK